MLNIETWLIYHVPQHLFTQFKATGISKNSSGKRLLNADNQIHPVANFILRYVTDNFLHKCDTNVFQTIFLNVVRVCKLTWIVKTCRDRLIKLQSKPNCSFKLFYSEQKKISSPLANVVFDFLEGCGSHLYILLSFYCVYLSLYHLSLPLSRFAPPPLSL